MDQNIINNPIIETTNKMLSQLEIINKENGIEYTEAIKNQNGQDIYVRKDLYKLYQNISKLREIFSYENMARECIEMGSRKIYLPLSINGSKKDKAAKIVKFYNEVLKANYDKCKNVLTEEQKNQIENQFEQFEALFPKEKTKEIDQLSKSNDNVQTNDNESNEIDNTANVEISEIKPKKHKVAKVTSAKKHPVWNFIKRKAGIISDSLDTLTEDKVWENFKKKFGSRALKLTAIAVAGIALYNITPKIFGYIMHVIGAIGSIGTASPAALAAATTSLITGMGGVVGLIGILYIWKKLAKKNKKKGKPEEEETLTENPEEPIIPNGSKDSILAQITEIRKVLHNLVQQKQVLEVELQNPNLTDEQKAEITANISQIEQNIQTYKNQLGDLYIKHLETGHAQGPVQAQTL